MKLKKLILSISLAVFVLFPVNVKAVDNNEGTISYLSPEEIQEMEEMALEKAKSQTIKPLMDEIVENWEASGSTTTSWGPYKAAFSQDAQGHILSEKGSGYYWADSSKTSGSWAVGISIGGKYASVSIAYEPGQKSSASGGIFEKCPDNLIGKKTKLFCRRQYKVNRYSVYRKNKYDSGKGTFVGYRYIPIKIAAQTKVAAYNAY